MKKLFCLMSLCLCLFAGTALIVSCSSDDEPAIKEVEAGITDDGNTLTLVYENGAATRSEIATFDDEGLCIKFIEQDVYPNKSLANTEWDYLKEEFKDYPDEWKLYSRKGNTITYDATEKWEGSPKADVRKYMDELLMFYTKPDIE